MKVESDLLHLAATKELSRDEYMQLFVLLSNTPSDYLVDALTPFDIVNILSFLDFLDEDSLEISKDITKYLLPLFPKDFADSTADLLMAIVNAENYILSTMIFDELSRRISSGTAQSEPIRLTRPFVELVLDLVFADNLALTSSAQRLLINYSKQSRETCQQAFVPTIQSRLAAVATNAVHLMRYLDVAMAVAVTTLDREIFQLALSGDAVVAILDGLVRGDDLLAQLSGLELVRQLVANQLGYQSLTCCGLLADLSSRLPTVAGGPLCGVALPAHLAVFAELCVQQHCVDALLSYPQFVQVLAATADSSDAALRMQVLEIVATVAAIADCKLFVSVQYASLIPKAVAVLVKLFDRSSTEYRARAGAALTMIFSAPSPNHGKFSAVAEVNRQWFSGVNVDNALISSILAVVRLPIEPLKLAGLQLAGAISNQRWGARLIADQTELVDYLMVRCDQWKSCIDAKFELVGNLVDVINRCADDQSPVANDDIARKLQQYYSEGKYFSDSRRAEMLLDEDV